MSGPADAGETEPVTFAEIFAEVQSLVTDTVALFTSNPTLFCEVLTERQILRAINTPRLQAALFGTAVESVVTDKLMEHPVFSEVLTHQYHINHENNTMRADFCVNGDPTSCIDITTNLDEQAHIDRYESFGLSCACATFDTPSNLDTLFAASVSTGF